MELSVSTDRILARIDDGVGYLTFNNPARHNALSLEMWQAIAEVADRFESDDQVRVVVMSGAGGKAFVSGADISEFDKVRGNASQEASYGKVSARGGQALAGLTKPLIAHITGYCIGGGLATALHADVRFATPDSTFGIPAARLGLGYDYEGLAKLARIVGPARARDIMFSARFLTATEAKDAGIVQFLVSRDQIDEHVDEYARKICSNAPLTVKAAKAALNAYERGALKDDVAAVRQLINDCFNSMDYREGRKAFAEKRKPEFAGN